MVVLEWIVVRLFAMLGSGRVRVETGCLLELGWWSAPRRCDGGPEAEEGSPSCMAVLKTSTFKYSQMSTHVIEYGILDSKLNTLRYPHCLSQRPSHH